MAGENKATTGSAAQGHVPARAVPMRVMIRMIRVVHRDANLLAADRVYLDAAPSRRTPSGREPRRSSPVVDISAVGAEQRKGRPGSDALLSRGGLFSLRREAVPLLVSNAVFEYGVFVVEQSAIAAWRRSHCERTARRPSTRSNHLDRKLLAGGGRENNIASTRTIRDPWCT